MSKTINTKKPTIISPGFLWCLAILLCLSCSIDNKLPLEQEFQKVLDKGIKKYDVNGVSAAVVFADGREWKGTSGISHDTVTIKPDMVFAIGSITKNFVAALTLQLAQEGKLSLDDPILKWLPAYPHVNSEITIRQLLNHTSGIYMFWSNQKIWDDLKKDRSKIWTPEEVLTYIKEPYFEPGTGFRYSNTNYLLLAMIITKATNSTLSSELRHRFWQPLNIKSACLSMEETVPDNQAHVYGDNFNNDGSYLDLTFLPRESHESITYGSSGIFITANDLAKWSNALFEGKVLTPQSLDEMLQFVDFRAGGNMSRYALGVQLFNTKYSNGKLAYGHSGANIGGSTYMIYLPKHHFSTVVMINNMNHSCTEYIITNLINVSLKEYDDYSLISTSNSSYLIYPLLLGLSFVIINFLRKMKRRSARKEIKAA